jgi:hypothetical protein
MTAHMRGLLAAVILLKLMGCGSILTHCLVSGTYFQACHDTGEEGHDFHKSRHDVARNSSEISFSPHAAEKMQTQGTGDLPLGNDGMSRL